MSPAPARGRPRTGVSPHPDLPAAEQILRAAAELFVGCGYGATSTRAIAAAVGIRQASLYHHFPSKADILAELLTRTVAPSLDAAHGLLADPAPPAVRLHRLVTVDCRLLLDAPANVGALYTLPEVRAEHFAGFRAQRAGLRAAYATLVGAAVAPGATPGPPGVLADVVFGLVESVIGIRGQRADAPGAAPDDRALVDAVARASLRVLGWDERAVERIAHAAAAPPPSAPDPAPAG